MMMAGRACQSCSSKFTKQKNVLIDVGYKNLEKVGRAVVQSMVDMKLQILKLNSI